MALLWNVLRKEEAQKRPVDLLGATKGSSSVYFKTTKVRSSSVLLLLSGVVPPKINRCGNIHIIKHNVLDKTQVRSKSEVEISSLCIMNHFSAHGKVDF